MDRFDANRVELAIAHVRAQQQHAVGHYGAGLQGGHTSQSADAAAAWAGTLGRIKRLPDPACGAAAHDASTQQQMRRRLIPSTLVVHLSKGPYLQSSKYHR